MQKTKFRLYSKKLFLTYSQINKNINLDVEDIQIKKNILKQLEEKIKEKNSKIEEYVLSLEHHLDGNKHIHVFLELQKRIDIRDHTFFDININENKNIHGNYQSGKNKFNIISYIIKTDNNYISNKKYYVKDGLLLRPLEHILDVLKKDGLDEALKILIKEYPEIAILKAGLLKKNLEIINDSLEKENIVTKTFDKDSFNIPVEFLNFIENERFKERTLCLWGPSGTGKTELAKATVQLISEKTKILHKPIFIRNLNQLKEIKNFKNTVLILDDINWSDISREEKINMLDLNNPCSIRVLYNVVTVPAGTPKITTNNHLNDLIHTKNDNIENGLKELVRRLDFIEIKNPIFNINITTNIYNIENK